MNNGLEKCTVDRPPRQLESVASSITQLAGKVGELTTMSRNLLCNLVGEKEVAATEQERDMVGDSHVLGDGDIAKIQNEITGLNRRIDSLGAAIESLGRVVG